MLQGQIYSGGNESWREYQAGDLDLEPERGVWVRVHDNSASIANGLANAAGRHDGGEEVRLVAEAENELENSGKGEEGDEEAIET